MSHLMLSRHGIWYYRRVNLTPRKLREIRISLRTRSKRVAGYPSTHRVCYGCFNTNKTQETALPKSAKEVEEVHSC